MRQKHVIITMFLVLVFPLWAFAKPVNERQISSEDRVYLERLLQDTWRYIDYYISPKTGFPYDSSHKTSMTNTTNIGLYLADIAVAHHLGYIDKQAAIARARKILDSLSRIENWNNLYNNWLSVEGETKAKLGVNNISDYNKLPAGIIMLRQEFPELAKECTDFLNKIDWSVFYAKSIDGINYEFDVVNKKTVNPINICRGEDKILGAFLAVASDKVPASTWDHHNMEMEERYGLKYYKHGWQGGGLFMQFICGIFLDERGTKLGYSEANFALAQIVHADKIGSPVWGWSACNDPKGGYMGWGVIRDDVVTPHASALAIEMYPLQAIANLKKLEAMGLREKFVAGGNEHEFGFYDSIDLSTKKISRDFLVLDQSMLFLSICNYLHKEVVRDIFGRDPLVKNGYKLLQDYHITDKQKKEFAEYLAKQNETDH